MQEVQPIIPATKGESIMRISAVRPILVFAIALSALLLACADEKQEEGLDDDERDQTAEPSRARERAALTDAPTPAATTAPPTASPTPEPTAPPTEPPTAPPPVIKQAPAPIITQQPAPAGNCDPSYPTVCIPPFPPDLDCGEISFRQFQVIGSDPHGFDADNDGVGCESN